MAKILDAILEEATLRKLQTDACFAKQRQHLIEVLDVFVVCLREHDDVVEVDETHLPPHPREYYVECSLECGGCVLEAERHSQVPERA